MSNPESRGVKNPIQLTKLAPRYIESMGGVLLPLNGKRPIHKDWINRRYSASKVIAKCRAEGSNIGWSIPDGVAVVDIDPRNGATPEIIEAFDLEFGTDLIANPRRVRTGSGGYHIFYSVPPGTRFVNDLKEFPGLEFKGAGRQVVVAGSIHPDTGKPYVIEGDFSAPMLELPELALRAITRPDIPTTTASGGQLTAEDAAKVLERLDPTDFRDHDKWLKLMMAVHHATLGDARQEWVNWSGSDPQYADQAEVIGRRWDSLRADSGMARITIGTLRYFLAEVDALDVLPPDQDAAHADFEDVDDLDVLAEADPVKLNDVRADNIDLVFRLVNIGGKVRIVFMGKSSLDKNIRVPEVWAVEDFKHALRNRFVNVESKSTKDDGSEQVVVKRMPLADWWLTRKDRYTYDGIIFDASGVGEQDEINLWRGYGVKPNPSGDWSLMRKHIRNVIANDDPASDSYIMKWLAWAIQNPTRHCEVALVLLSEEKGTGKGFLGRAMCRLFGAHGLHISNRGHLVGRFNAHFMQVGLLFCDEALWPGHKDDEGVLKALITEPSLMVEPKGVNAFQVLNALKIIMASNEKWVVPASGNERRYAVFDVSTVRTQDHAYFDRIRAQLDKGGYGAMLHDLMTMDLNGWHPRQDIPQTDALARQKELTASPEIKLMGDILAVGYLPGQQGKANRARASWFYEYARKTAKNLQWWTDHEFVVFLEKLGARRKHSNGIVWVFPSLADMRAQFLAEAPWWPPFDSNVTEWMSEFDDE